MFCPSDSLYFRCGALPEPGWQSKSRKGLGREAEGKSRKATSARRHWLTAGGVEVASRSERSAVERREERAEWNETEKSEERCPRPGIGGLVPLGPCHLIAKLETTSRLAGVGDHKFATIIRIAGIGVDKELPGDTFQPRRPHPRKRARTTFTSLGALLGYPAVWQSPHKRSGRARGKCFPRLRRQTPQGGSSTAPLVRLAECRLWDLSSLVLK